MGFIAYFNFLEKFCIKKSFFVIFEKLLWIYSYFFEMGRESRTKTNRVRQNQHPVPVLSNPP